MPTAKRGAEKTPEAKAKRIAALRASSPDLSAKGALAKANPNRPLTEKMKAFVAAWAQGETIYSAAIRAGYSDGGQMAYRLAKDPAICQLASNQVQFSVN